MTGSDDGGFKPHPGDPWHPDWSEDAESGDEVETQPDALVSESEQPKKKKGRRRGRRGRRSDKVAAESEVDPASFEPVAVGEGGPSDDGAAESEVDPASFEPVADGEGGPSDDGAAESEVDPASFEPVTDGEGEPSDVELPGVGEGTIDVAPESEEEKPPRSFVEDENAPAPAWTSDRDPDPDKLLPVEQPSWVGQTTEATAGIEAVGFEPTVLPEDEATPDDASGLSADEQEPGLIGEYGVAGPEAFDALEEDDASTGELDDWGAFVEGSPSPAGATGSGDVGGAIPPSDQAAGDGEMEDWTAPAPKKRRGLFRRGKRDRVDEVIEDGFVGSAAGEDAAAEEPAVPSQFGAPEELPAGADAFDEWVESEPDQRRIGKDDLDRVEDLVAGSVEDVAPAVGWEDGSAGAVGSQPADLNKQPDLFGDTPEVGSTPELATEQSESIAERDAGPVEPVEQDDAGLDDGQDWEGDPGRVPAAWFAEIDEDQVVPPTSGESSETELSDAVDGPRQDGQGQVEPTDLFDIEEPIGDGPQPAAVEQQPQETVPVPDGYEPWHQAVTDAVEVGAAADQHADDGTYEYDQPALQASEGLPAEGLPAGFEPFPGETGMEQFELPEETLRDELSSGGFEPGWVTDHVDPGQMPTEEMDSAFGAGEEFDEQIYAAGGTIEHRDLAAAIADAEDEDTQWQAISAAMPGVETGVVGFEDVAHLGTGADYVATPRSDLGLRVVTGVVLVALLFGSLFVSDVAFAIFVSLVVMLGLLEFYGSLRRSGYLPLGIFGIIGGVGTLSAVWFHGPLAIPVGVLLTSMVTFFFYAFSQTRRDALSNAGLTVLGVGWIVGPIAFVIPIVRAQEHVTLVFAIVAVTAATDVGAFSFGRAWGKSPLAPVLSPNKTAEGLAGGVMLALAVAGAIGFFELGPFDLRSGLALGTIVAFLAPIGDLAESMVKRSLAIKDMGSILPGHGGVLDRIDAFLFVIPVAWVFYESIGFLG
ncbi:MAG: phosphatidate cytidylyltransferase [Acidimicrobiia bacterium]